MKERIDVILVDKRLVESRTKAQWLITNGYVSIGGKKILKPGKKIDNTLEITLEKEFPYVSRGGLKLEAALQNFSISVVNKTCMDIGASVGGFTDCLLKNGAKRIYAIDKAEDLLHPSLRCEKVKGIIIPMLGIDARNIPDIIEKLDICTIDITFVSLRTILPKIKKFIKLNGDIIALLKPIFETEFRNIPRFKIIQDPQQLYQILTDLNQWCRKNQFFPSNIIKSPILGKEGSIEFFIHIKLEDLGLNNDFNKLVRNAIL
ncbi:MAG: TlyA family RNA methyltransferase [Candidatus Thorarchaeota archaeon]